MTPRVSVVMPVRNGERFLREALDSTLGQTLADLELIVVDDGSTDSTPEILSTAGDRDPRVRVQHQQPGGLTVAINVGCALARAPLIARMDADDVMLPDRLERQVAYLDAHPNVALLGGGVVLVDETGNEIDREPGRAQLDFLVRNELTHATVMMRADAFVTLGGYRLDQSEDYDLWLRFDEHYGVAALADHVIRYRFHPGQFSVTALERQALGFLCVREAAIVRRRGEPDPLDGVERLDDTVLARLDIPRERLDEAIVSDAVNWAATLTRVRRDDDAAALLDAAAAVDGAPRRSELARRARSLLLKRAVRHGRITQAARELAAYARGR
jgi:glycosyltransferase involved in cell wall biosynthesis